MLCSLMSLDSYPTQSEGNHSQQESIGSGTVAQSVPGNSLTCGTPRNDLTDSFM